MCFTVPIKHLDKIVTGNTATGGRLGPPVRADTAVVILEIGVTNAAFQDENRRNLPIFIDIATRLCTYQV